VPRYLRTLWYVKRRFLTYLTLTSVNTAPTAMSQVSVNSENGLDQSMIASDSSLDAAYSMFFNRCKALRSVEPNGIRSRYCFVVRSVSRLMALANPGKYSHKNKNKPIKLVFLLTFCNGFAGPFLWIGSYIIILIIIIHSS